MWRKFSILVFSSLLIIPVNCEDAERYATGFADLGPIAQGPPNLDTEIAQIAIAGKMVEVIRAEISPLESDISLITWITALRGVASFDAVAPYTPTAVGLFSNLGRRPPNERTVRNKNVALFYCSLRVLANALPDQAYKFMKVLKDAGLDPDDTHESTTDAIGIGNSCARLINEHFDNDGMNVHGNIGAKSPYNHKQFQDYTGYQPVNTHYKLNDPRRWQPAVKDKNGIFTAQMFITPQLANIVTHSYDNASQFQAKPHGRLLEGARGMELYKESVDEVIASSAGLTDEQKLAAEFFDDKGISLGFILNGAGTERNLTLNEFLFYVAYHHIAVIDTMKAVWKEKTRWDAVRPFSAIKFIYGDRHITAYCGKGKGTCSDLPASDWTSYMPVSDHPEYPSGAASICGATAEISRLFFGDDQAVSRPLPFLKGSSRREPGITPKQDTYLRFNTWTEFENMCAMSRVWGGVHFVDAVEEGLRIGREVARHTYEHVTRHVYPRQN